MIKVNNKTVSIKRFPDGTLNIKGNPALNQGTVLLSWHYENDAEFMAIVFLTRYYQSRSNKVDLFLPYVPNARMDRIEVSEDIFTMKYFAEMINTLNFNKVYVMDVHSSVVIATIKNVVIIKTDKIVNNLVQTIEEMTSKKLLMFYPDEGAVKRYSKETNNPFAFAVKNRDWKTGKILGLEVLGINAESIKGKNVLIRDDICSKGDTCYYVAKKLKEMGAGKIFLYVTHCEHSILTGEFGEDRKNLLDTGLIEYVFTTNSICRLTTNDKIGIVEVNLKASRNSNNKCDDNNDSDDSCGCDCNNSCHGFDCMGVSGRGDF